MELDIDPSGEKKFYMTYSRDRPNELIPWIEEHSVPLLENALHRWSHNSESFMDMWEYDTDHVIDAGGYNVQSTFADRWGNLKVEPSKVESELESDAPFYPWTVEEYHEWAAENSDEFEWVTVMDYACEDRFSELWSVDERVEATIDNTVEHYSHDPDYNVLPVLQGRSVEEYVQSYERLKDQGIPVDHVGIGTVCRLSSTEEIIELENNVRERIDANIIHGFGVKVDSFSRGARFDSADSAAWVYGPSNGEMYLLRQDDDGDIRKTTVEEDSSLLRTVESFKTYYTYVSWLQNGVESAPIDERLEFAEAYENGEVTEENFRERWV